MEDNDHIGARLDRLPLSRFHFRIFGIISFGLLLTGFLSYSGNVVLAKLINNGWSNNYLNAAFTSALMLGYFIGSLTGGFIGDYLGRRKAFRINLLLVGISATAAAFVPNMYWLIFFRCLMGTGMGGIDYGWICFFYRVYPSRCTRKMVRASLFCRELVTDAVCGDWRSGHCVFKLADDVSSWRDRDAAGVVSFGKVLYRIAQVVSR
ncbi:membrane transport protein [Salmonella enterica subsp. enterica serovar Sanjuan]|uniref:Membrane transport protein n=1 Tax=Salmonella enterica subsp. enterica serovar Sanjuan TaxID=1160765 RepID=A0A3S4FJN5_SALET|nr:membrane transport protein [Salmonella enterica subsp. enterica serovar Sanjuan]